MVGVALGIGPLGGIGGDERVKSNAVGSLSGFFVNMTRTPLTAVAAATPGSSIRPPLLHFGKSRSFT